MTCFSRFSFMKCLSISTCFVRSCWTRLPEMLMDAWLSQNNLQAFFGGKFNSHKSFLTHEISVVPLAIPLNSALALDRATTFYFLLLQVTRFPLTRVNYGKLPTIPITRLVCFCVTNGWSFFLKKTPLLLVPFKYLKILITASMCGTCGRCMNLLTTSTTYEISSLVKDMYMRFPTNFWYCSLFANYPSCTVWSPWLATIGVSAG